MLGGTSLLAWKCERLFDTDVTGACPWETDEEEGDCLWSFQAVSRGEISASNFGFREVEV